MPFIRIVITSDAATLADDAVQRLQTTWPTWEPNDGDLEVVLLGALAPMAQNAAEVAGNVPDSIFRAYGTNLVGLQYQQGLPATGIVTISAVDAAGHDAEERVEFYLGAVAFLTDENVVIPLGASEADFAFTALINGTEGNELSGSADPSTALPWLDSLVVQTPTAGGTDAETDLDYQDRLADRLQLQSTTLVTGRDFEFMALEDDRIGRAVAFVNQARQVTVAITDNEGEPADVAVKDDLEALYEDYRQVNTLYSVIDPTYTTINVDFSLVALPSYEPNDVRDRAIAAVQAWLDPLNWGRPSDLTETSVWLNEPVVYRSELVRVLSVLGVRRVVTATLNGGTADINLTGIAPLTRPGTITGTATS